LNDFYIFTDRGETVGKDHDDNDNEKDKDSGSKLRSGGQHR
jgi:hypothetical protein